jgi:hypothetical protein
MQTFLANGASARTVDIPTLHVGQQDKCSYFVSHILAPNATAGKCSLQHMDGWMDGQMDGSWAGLGWAGLG